MTDNQYKVIKISCKYTIGKQGNDDDGIYKKYWWETKQAAQEAADTYNNYQGYERLAGHDVIKYDGLPQCEPEMIELYRLFNAIKPCNVDDELDKNGLMVRDDHYIASHNADCDVQEQLIADGKQVMTWSVQNDMADNDIFCGTYTECLNAAIDMAFAGDNVAGIALIELREGLLFDYCHKFVAIEKLIPGWGE